MDGKILIVDLNKTIKIIEFEAQNPQLYKRKQIEEATTKFNEGYQIFIKESPIIYNELYSNKQCENVTLIYKKILIDSGTLGTKANSQIIRTFAAHSAQGMTIST